MYLKTTAEQTAPILILIFNQSLPTGELPSDWLSANVSPIFKKGDKHTAENYRPVSLTCVCCKLLEHCIVRHIRDHLDLHNILTDREHGFRSRHSCETQLITTVDDLLAAEDENVRIDMAILDFSKAFDMVPHKRLMHKLQHYGISGNTHSNCWINSFLTNRNQQVVIDGECSTEVPVTSGVPQGSVLGPTLFLVFINDLPDHVKSEIRLFADDCLIYRHIYSLTDPIAMQQDLFSIGQWARDWGMQFKEKKLLLLRSSF